MASFFHCKDCNKTFTFTKKDKKLIGKHLNTKTHNVNHMRSVYNEDEQKRNYTDNEGKYECKACKKFIVNKKDIINRHNNTKSHIKKIETYTNNSVDYEPNQVDKYFCNICKKGEIQNTKYHILRHNETKKHQAILKKETYGV